MQKTLIEPLKAAGNFVPHQRHWPAKIAAASMTGRSGEPALRHAEEADRQLWADYVDLVITC